MTRAAPPVLAVTGGAQGIGEELARLAIARGHRVALLDVQQDRVEALARELGEQGAEAIGIRTDVSSPESVEAAFTRIDEHFGGLDTLVNAAGVLNVADIEETDPADFDRVLRVNLKGVFLTMKYAARLLRESADGSIVNFSSLAGRTGLASLSAYCASKAGVISLTQVAAREFAPGIRVNAVCPGIVETPMQLEEYRIIGEKTGKSADEIRDGWLTDIPLGRFQQPADVAELVLFLASRAAQNITGQSVGIDGGLHMA